METELLSGHYSNHIFSNYELDRTSLCSNEMSLKLFGTNGSSF